MDYIDRDTTAGAHGPAPNKFGRVGHAPNSSRIQHKASAETERATEATGGPGLGPGGPSGGRGVPGHRWVGTKPGRSSLQGGPP